MLARKSMPGAVREDRSLAPSAMPSPPRRPTPSTAPPARPLLRAAPHGARPHQRLFALGLTLAALTGLWWAALLLARALGLAVPWAVPAGLAHGLLFALGAMPAFIAGFFFTAGPRWLQVAPDLVPLARLHRYAGVMALGWACAWPGLHLDATLAGAGMVMVALGWGGLWRLAGLLLRSSCAPDRLHLRGVHGAWWVGVVSLGVTGLALLAGQFGIARLGLQGALWWSLLPIFLMALHRMVPMFADFAPWPVPERRLFWAALAACAWGGVWALREAWPTPQPMPAPLLLGRAGIEALAAALLLAQAWHWRRMARLPLMALMLCGGVWLAVGIGLSAASAAARGLGGAGLGLAPQHAVFAGGLASLMLAQVTRVSSAHAGRAVALDRGLGGLVAILQLAVALRLWAAMAPAAPSWVLPVAGVLWAVALTGWSLRLLGWLRPAE